MTDAVLKRLLGHQVPAWWRDAKFGIFVHWTPSAVPGFAPIDGDIKTLMTSTDPAPLARMPYTEWYENSLRFPDSPVAAYHREHYGSRPYEAFGADFDAGLDCWDPKDWARRFAAAGARYVVLVAKHHDGYCLWPSAVPNPHRSGWHTTRDVVGELAEVVRAEGLRFGLYYSGGLDWTFDARPIPTLASGAAAVPGGAYPAYAVAQVRELIDRYRPSLLWNDIAWPQTGRELWPLLEHYLDVVPDGVVNDRWLPRSAATSAMRIVPMRRLADTALRRVVSRRGALIPPKPPFFDVRTPEYTTLDDVPPWPWECVRGMDHSFGFNRASRPEHFVTRQELLGSLVDIVAKGGNLLLNVGPTGDAALPPEQVERLDWLATWTSANGAALYRTRPWVHPAATTPEGVDVRFTTTGEDVFAVLMGPGPVTGRVTLPGVAATPRTSVGLLAPEGASAVSWTATGDGLEVDLGTDSTATVPAPPVLALRSVTASPL